MFTGIVQGLGTVVDIEDKQQLRVLSVALPKKTQANLNIGASIANNGCCLTITHINEHIVTFDIMAETLKKTNLGLLQIGDKVNIERAAHFGDEIGGHLMSGHIFTTTKISKIEKTSHNKTIWFKLTNEIKDYILPKGFIGLNGCSLTIGDVNDTEFNIHLIPETMDVTLFGDCKIDETINLEIDPQTQAIVDTVNRYLDGKMTHHESWDCS